ncbi:MAG: rhodanese-like domain-containing protein [Byssovorax sp.]
MKHRTILWLMLLALPLGSALGCAKQRQEGGPKAEASAAEAEPFGRMTMEELDARMAEAKAGKLNLKIYDNNHKDVFEKGHIPGATWVAFNEIKASDLPADKEATLVFYCANEH